MRKAVRTRAGPQLVKSTYFLWPVTPNIMKKLKKTLSWDLFAWPVLQLPFATECSLVYKSKR
jgi:hypothetical protein